MDNVGEWAVLPDKIKIGRGQMPDFVAQVADHGQGLEKNLGQQDRRADVQVDAPFEAGDQGAENPEVIVAGLADGRSRRDGYE